MITSTKPMGNSPGWGGTRTSSRALVFHQQTSMLLL